MNEKVFNKFGFNSIICKFNINSFIDQWVPIKLNTAAQSFNLELTSDFFSTKNLLLKFSNTYWDDLVNYFNDFSAAISKIVWITHFYIKLSYFYIIYLEHTKMSEYKQKKIMNNFFSCSNINRIYTSWFKFRFCIFVQPFCISLFFINYFCRFA